MTKFPILYAKSKDGGIKQWSIRVASVGKYAIIVTNNGKVDGKMIERSKTITEGKNIGKSNATTPLEQAYLEAEASWTHKKERKEYTESMKDAEKHISTRPMLAHKYKERKKHITWPAYVQPKLDGVRCMTTMNDDGSLTMTSRNGKDYYAVMKENKKLIERLKEIMRPGQTLDGELYYHGWSLQRIASATKKAREDTQTLEYWIFDDATPDTGRFEHRWGSKSSWQGAVKNPLRAVATEPCKTEADMEKFHKDFIKEGFEGTIIRNAASEYLYGHRSNDLLKKKDMEEKEYKIIGVESETQDINGIHYTCIMFKCKTKDGAEFNVRPKGTLLYRQEMLKAGEGTYLGKQLTVRYQTITSSTDGNGKAVPQFPVGIIRDYE